MKITELVIGNWVTGEKWREKPFQIIRINDGGKFVYGKTATSTVGPFFLDELEPIPLTREILERNGFTHCLTAPCGYYNAPAYDMFDILFHVSEDNYEDTWHTEVFTDHNDNNFVLYNLCYVHELQHALRLCGLSDLADDFKLEN